MRGIIFSSGTSQENYQAAYDVDIPLFAAFFGGNPPEGTYRIEDPIGPFWLDSKTWCYPVGPDFEELANSLSLGTIVDVSWEDVYPPVPE